MTISYSWRIICWSSRWHTPVGRLDIGQARDIRSGGLLSPKLLQVEALLIPCNLRSFSLFSFFLLLHTKIIRLTWS
jgi:hypothetical protein